MQYERVREQELDTYDVLYQRIAVLEQALQERENELTTLRNTIQDIQQHEREREAIISVANAMRTASCRDDMVPILLNQIVAVLHTHHVALVMGEPGLQSVTVTQGYGELKQIVNIYERTGKNIIEQVISSGQSYITNQAYDDLVIQWNHTSNFIQSVACVPLIAHTQTIGAVCVARSRPITVNDMRLLNAICDMAANAMHRSSLHEQTRRRLQHIQALHAIDESITTTLDVYQTLHVVLEQVAQNLNVDAAAVLLYNSVTESFEYAAGVGFRFTIIEQSDIIPGEGFAGVAAIQRESVIVPDIRIVTDWTRPELMEREEFLSYYGVPLITRKRVKGILELFHRSPHGADQEWFDFLDILASQTAIVIEHAELFAELERSNDELVLSYDATIQGLARALELRDAETEGHSRRVTRLTVELAEKMGFSDDDLVHIRRGAILHDIGKVAIPDAILLKSGPLTDLEYAVMQLHTTYAYNMLSSIPFLRPALDIPYCHHEKWDGSGYPQGLVGDQIPLTARMFAVVDVYDALRSDRPYRKKWPAEKVCNYLQEQAGEHFDPYVVKVFLEMISENEVGTEAN